MKKYIALTVLAISIFTSSLTGCQFSKVDKNTLDPAPVVITSGIPNILLTMDKKANTAYINIYRQDVTDEKKPGNLVNIGLVFPDNQNPASTTCSFTDIYFLNDHKYVYSARYTTKGNGNGVDVTSFWTEATSPVMNEKHPATTAQSLVYSDQDGAAYFEYDKDSYTLTIRGADFVKPAIDNGATPVFTPKIILGDETGKKCVYKLNSIDKGNVIPLSILLANDFPNGGTITVEGLIGEGCIPAESSSSVKIPTEFVYWTEPLKVRLKDTSGNQIKSFEVTAADIQTGLDYSDYLD